MGYKHSVSTLARTGGYLLFGSLIVRLMTLGIYPLMDTTEARYGEMARIMYETGNWITPMFDYNVPFWGKPPLFAWLSAMGFEVLGVNEFAARVPHLMVGVLILYLVWYAAKRTLGESMAWLATGVLATTTAFIVIVGAVMTDTALTLAVSLSMVSFWLNWQNKSSWHGYLFFTGLAIGMLAKGPLALVLVGISLTMWLLPDHRWKRIPNLLPWKGGIILFLSLTLPWYLIAEWKTPGFLNYFIVGEHIMRFVVSGWEGDLYGTAHNEVRGTIWLFWLLAAFPWAPVLLYQVCRKSNPATLNTIIPDGYIGYLWCWMLAPMLLFTFAGNILPSYVLPGLPALALLVCAYQKQKPLATCVYRLGEITPIMIAIIAILLAFNLVGKEAEKGLLATWKNDPSNVASDLVYINQRPFSAQFYSQGKAEQKNLPLEAILNEQQRSSYYVIEKNKVPEGFIWDKQRCDLISENQKRQLVHCNPPSSYVQAVSRSRSEAEQEEL
ncbi:glycosyltransferase [Photobacterium aquae]|uniref:Glycosyltransferase n=1 Tax=Photobacterium aquae TaxID=1195763 RepID=A0A0J1GXN9_9GAMM|nr:glycosyltransferase family 39 protein [Photobacterium aquae]KLV04189.1 glycosyltransferase [Photobacterium aquae]